MLQKRGKITIKIYCLSFATNICKTKLLKLVDNPTHDLNTNEYKYLPSDMIFRRLLYAALDEGRRNRVALEDERIIETVKRDKLEYELEEMQQELTETKNQLSAMIKLSASFGASPDQIASQLGITRAEEEKEINDLKK